MAETFRFELVTPERVLVPETPRDAKEKVPPAQANSVLVPGIEGDFTVLAGHAPVISSLRPGVLEIRLAGGETRRVLVRGGIAEVDPESLTILSPSAIDLAAAGPDDVGAALAAAEADLAAAGDDESRRLASLAIEGLKGLGVRQS